MQKNIDTLTDGLFAGLNENPLWETFLDRLRIAADAHRAILQCHPPGGVFSRAVYRISGQIDGDEEDLFRHWMSLAPPPAHLVQPDKAFDILKAYRQDPPALDQALRQEFHNYELTALRALKITERSGVEAWLFVTRNGGELDQSVDALLDALAPVFRGVVEVYVAREQERYRAALAMQAARQATQGWFTLDAECRVIEYDESCDQVLAGTSALRITGDGRLKIEPPQLESKVRETVERFAQGQAANQQVFRLSRKPWIEITLQPARRTPVSTKTPAAALMYISHDIAQFGDRASDLMRNLRLSKREAELAMALGRGLRISEAAEDLSLTVNTARSYLRSIYSKTGASGLSDLVRLVNQSLSKQNF